MRVCGNMRRFVLSGVFAILQYAVCAQQIIGGFPFSAVPNYGDTIGVSIVNQGVTPATFFVPDPHTGREGITYNDSALMEYLHSISLQHVDLEEQKEAIADSLAIIIKSEMVVHQQRIFDPWNSDSFDAVYGKKYSAMGAFHAQASRWCGDQCVLFSSLLVKSGLFVANDIQFVEFDSLHSLVQVMIKGAYKLYDMDVNEVFLTIPYGASPNGFASAKDISQNPALIDSAPLWHSKTYWGESIPLNIKKHLGYKQMWQTLTPRYEAFSVSPKTQELGGWITLCPSCKLDFSYVVPYYLDVTTTHGALIYSSFLEYKDSVAAGRTEYKDSIDLLAANYFEIDSAHIQQLYSMGGMYIKTSQRFLMTAANETPTVDITIPSGTQSVTDRELHFPGFILGIDGSNLSVPGNYLKSGYTISLWDSEEPVVQNSDVHYMCDEYIAPRNNVTHLKASYNPRLYDFFNGFKIDHLGTPDTLTVIKTVNRLPVVETAVSPILAGVNQPVYPNPSTGTFFVPSNGPGDVVITNLLGNQVATIPVQGPLTRVKLEKDGIYFLHSGGAIQKVVVQQ